MSRWLFKEEPEHYSFADLQRDGSTLWDGVDNNLARLHLRKVRKGDRVLLYQTGKLKAIVGEMKVTQDAHRDPQSDDPKSVVVRVEPVRLWRRVVSLAEVKNDPELAEWDLVRMPRLSVMPVNEDQWRRVEELSQTAPQEVS